MYKQTNSTLRRCHTLTEIFKEKGMELDLLEGEALVGVLDQQLHAEILRRVRSIPNKATIVHGAHLIGLVVRIAEGFRELSNILLLRYTSLFSPQNAYFPARR